MTMIFLQEHRDAETAETERLVALLTGVDPGYYSMVDGTPHVELGRLPPSVEYISRAATPGKLRMLLGRHIDARRAHHGYRVVRRGSTQLIARLSDDAVHADRVARDQRAAPYLEKVLSAMVAPIDLAAVRSALRHSGDCLRVAIGGGVPGTPAYHYTRATISPADRPSVVERAGIPWAGLRPGEVIAKANEVIAVALALAG